eukprot:9055467-Alexandrium_andersonii.AAC.1
MADPGPELICLRWEPPKDRVAVVRQRSTDCRLELGSWQAGHAELQRSRRPMLEHIGQDAANA